MTNTEFIHEIIQELEKNQVKCSERELFELIVFSVSNEVWKKKYKSKWSSWRWRRRTENNFNYEGVMTESLTKSPEVLQGISKTLDFNMTLWDAGTLKQKETIRKSVIQLLNKANPIDLSLLIKKELPITQQQKELLEEIKYLTEEDIAKLIFKHHQLFTEKSDNQAFLLQSIVKLYQKSYFEILHQTFLPSLFPRHKSKFEIIKIEADVLTHLKEPNYDKIIDLLNTVV